MRNVLFLVLLSSFTVLAGCSSPEGDGCAAGLTDCSGFCRDLREDDANCGACGAPCGPGEACVSGACEDYAVSFDFPAAGDTSVIGSPPYFWQFNDYVEGTRTTNLPSASLAVLHLALSNGLNGDTCDFKLVVNGTQVGTFRIPGGSNTFNAPVLFSSPVAGPTYTIRFQVVRTVTSGMGSVAISSTGSTVVLF